VTDRGVFVHIVVWNELGWSFDRTIQSILEATEAFPKSCLEITDNGSDRAVQQRLSEIRNRFPTVVVYRNDENLGFCAAHNQAVTRFLHSDCQYFLVLNPDTRLTQSAIDRLIHALRAMPGCELATPRILRCTDTLAPERPPIIDAAGMEFTPSFRHFDRESGQLDHGQRSAREIVFGGTGACLLITRTGVERLILPRFASFDRVLLRLYPQLARAIDQRSQLFDEAFFAYREDADLAMRAEALGIGCVYEPGSIVYHVRRVTPERRTELPPELNRLSVRNRFLLQLNHWRWNWPLRLWVEGILIRNAIVVMGVLLKERTSLSALWDAVRLAPRALCNRAFVRSHAYQSAARPSIEKT
jgi:GT2 family glycosyltransferase